jgi:hypothetical protein
MGPARRLDGFGEKKNLFLLPAQPALIRHTDCAISACYGTQKFVQYSDFSYIKGHRMV